MGLPPTMWRAARPPPPEEGGEEDSSRRAAASPGGGNSSNGSSNDDVRAARLEQLGLRVLLPDGVEGRAGLLISDGDGGGGRAAAATVWWCDSLQDASLLAHFAAYGLNDPSLARPQQWTRRLLEDAAHTLEAYLQACKAELDRVLPAWFAHGFLVVE
jgi:hypothetical protein